MRYTLIVGDAATYEEGGVHHAEFQKIDFIKTFFSFEEAEAQGEYAITHGHDTYVIAQNLCGVVTYNPKQGVTA
jgi:hypothetical protein